MVTVEVAGVLLQTDKATSVVPGCSRTPTSTWPVAAEWVSTSQIEVFLTILSGARIPDGAACHGGKPLFRLISQCFKTMDITLFQGFN